jgi:hypothetical protein
VTAPLPHPGDNQADGYDERNGPPIHEPDCECGHCPKDPD